MTTTPFQYDLFGTFLDTMNKTTETTNNVSYFSPRTPVADAIYKQKHAEAYAKEQAARERVRKQYFDDRHAVECAGSFADSLEQYVLNAISDNQTRVAIEIPYSVVQAGVCHSSKGPSFTTRLSFATEKFNRENPILKSLDSLKADGVKHKLTHVIHRSDSEDYELSNYHQLELTW